MENKEFWNGTEIIRKVSSGDKRVALQTIRDLVSEAERRAKVEAFEEARTRLVTEMNDRGDIAVHFAMNWFNAKINELK